ncbi:MAG: ribosome small subunit-dependent GTPase A [Chitinophagaceae bacterium]
MEALVYKSTGSWYLVKNKEGKSFKARIKGVLKIGGITSTNPVAVGDTVQIAEEHDADDTAMIVTIDDRHNYVARQSPANKNQHHIIASNLDQSMLICTLKDPKTSQGFIDRFLVSCEAYHVTAILVFNKCDLYKEKELETFEEWKETYQKIGYKVLLASVQQHQGMEAVRELLNDKTTLLSGHSGVGKSTIINHVFPEFHLRTKAVSGWSGKGMHTTTFAEMFDLPGGGRIIDTPGLREFGLANIERNELAHYYPEMLALINHCQYNDCMHIDEPGCAVKAAVGTGAIHSDRYYSYLNILDTIEKKSW